MAISPVRPVYTTPSPLRVLGALVIPPAGIPRRLLNVCLDAFNDVAGCLSESRDHDAKHDAYQLSVERLAAIGERRALAKGCGCEHAFRAIHADNRSAMDEDAKEDGLIDAAWCVAKRLAGAICKAFVLRKAGRRSGGSGRGHGGRR